MPIFLFQRKGIQIGDAAEGGGEFIGGKAGGKDVEISLPFKLPCEKAEEEADIEHKEERPEEIRIKVGEGSDKHEITEKEERVDHNMVVGGVPHFMRHNSFEFFFGKGVEESIGEKEIAKFGEGAENGSSGCEGESVPYEHAAVSKVGARAQRLEAFFDFRVRERGAFPHPLEAKGDDDKKEKKKKKKERGIDHSFFLIDVFLRLIANPKGV